MKSHTLIAICICFLTQSATAQSLPIWYQADPTPIVGGGWCLYSSKKVDSTLSNQHQAHFEYIDNFQLTRFGSLTKNNDKDFNVKNAVIGARGNINGKEILIIDHDLDESLTDEAIVFLPPLKKDPSIEYDSRYVYRSKINQDYSMAYEKIANGQIHQIKTHLGFTVNHKYDNQTDQLSYIDKWKLCFNQRLRYQGILDGNAIKISCYDFLPWMTAITFKVNTRDYPTREVAIKTPFRVNKGGTLFTIDSVDFINNKFLISEYGEAESFYFAGESLFSDEKIDTDSTTSNVKLVHVWGPWCRPCMANLPKLVEMQEKYKDAEFIGICEDKEKQAGAKAAKEINVKWKNIFCPLGKSNLNIMSYPTYIIVENNEVLGRFSDLKSAEKELMIALRNSNTDRQ